MDDLQSKIGPIMFKLMLEQETIADVFTLLNRFFTRLESNVNAHVDLAELQAALSGLGLISQSGLKELSTLPVAEAGKVNFREFVGYMASQFLKASGNRHAPPKTEDVPADELAAVNMSEGLNRALAPLAFRLISRTDDFNRLFALFSAMFDELHPNADGLLSLESFKGLLTVSDQLSLDALQTGPGDTISYNQFLGYWISQYIKEEAEEQEFKHKLRPTIMKLLLMHSTVTDLFQLLAQLFEGLAGSLVGVVTKDQARGLLLLAGSAPAAEQRLAGWNTAKPEGFRFGEFVSFYAQEFVASEPTGPGSDDVAGLDAATLSKLAPIAFKLGARSSELQRMLALFKEMFETFQRNGKVDQAQFESLLRELMDFVETPRDDSEGQLDFNGFLAFWVQQFATEK